MLVLEKHGFGGQITYSPKVENYPGTIQMSGNEFADKLLEQILALGAEVELEKAVAVEEADGHKLVRTEEGNAFEAMAVVIATGVKHRMLGLPGENELVGNGISFCAVCDGDFFSGQTVCVAGGGNSALQEAILLAEKCREVIILQDLPELTGEETLQKILRSRSNVTIETNRKIVGVQANGDGLTGVTVADRITGAARTIPCEGLFIAIGLIPENGPFADLAELIRLRRGLPHPDPRRVRGRGLPVEGHPPAHHRLRRRRRGRFGRVPVREREEIRIRIYAAFSFQ